MTQDIALGLGLLVNLLSTEVLGFPSGGFVVPGYLALFLNRPIRVLATFFIALLTWAIVHFILSRIMLLYGRRRFALTLLVGFIIAALSERFLGGIQGVSAEMRSIGHLIPGLLAAGMLSEGVIPTAAAALGGSALVRLLLVFLGIAGL